MAHSDQLTQQFYLVDRPNADTPVDKVAGTDVTLADGFHTGDAPLCPRCGEVLGMLEWLPPYKVELELYGRRFADIAIAGAAELLVSGRFCDLYQLSGFTGLSGFDPVQIVKLKRRRKNIEPPEYFKVDVIKSRTALDHAASGFDWKDGSPTCPECRANATLLRYQGLIVDMATYTGEDIFLPRELSGTILCNERFKSFCDQHELSGVDFIAAESYSYDFMIDDVEPD